jgi:uncharacterized protein with PIN domain
MNLLFDEMLGNLARWCRILGIDSSFYTGKSDSQLFQIAKAEDRTLVTRDLKLAERCGKGGVRFILVKGERIEEQTAQVLKESGAAVTFPEKTRCASCNGELSAVPKESVVGEVETDTFAHHERFWRCSVCKKVFWEGGHWRNIQRIYGKAKALA